MIFSASEIRASVVLSNLSEPDSGIPQGVSNSNDMSVSFEYVSYVGTSFVVGSVAGNLWDLNSATLSMDATNPSTTGAFVVGIYSNNTSGVPDPRPGSLLGTLTASIPAGDAPLDAGQYVYTASPGSIQLTAGQTYWLVASALSTTGTGQGYSWKVADSTSYTTQSTGWSVDASQSIATFGPGYTSDTATWSNDTNSVLDNNVWRTDSASGTARNWGADQFLQFSLDASISGAQEPSKAAFCLLGLLSLGLRRSRRR